MSDGQVLGLPAQASLSRASGIHVQVSTAFAEDAKMQDDIETSSAEKREYDDRSDELYTQSLGSLPAILNNGEPFPVDPLAQIETSQLTFRAVIVGSLLGLVVGASNIYLGLKTGFTFGAGLFGSMFGFAILKPLSQMLPPRWGGGYFGPKENCAVQSAATASGGLTSHFIAAVPAMYQLKVLTTPKGDLGRLFALTAMTAFYGLFFAVPLRKYYILGQKLVFPSPTATAFTIAGLHSTTTAAGRRASRKKIIILACSFFGALAYKVISGYAPGILWDWHIFWWFYTWGWEAAIRAESWGWWIELTPAFLGVGALSGLNASWSFMFGSVLAWAVIGPALIQSGLAVGIHLSKTIPGYMEYTSMSAKGNDFIHAESPRYWLLWPGITVMFAYSLAEVMYSVPTFWKALKELYTNTRYSIRRLSARKAGRSFTEPMPANFEYSNDPAPPHEQIGVWTWIIGLTASIILTLVTAKLYFDMSIGIGIISLILAFLFSFISVQSAGTTDLNPIGVISKASQLVVGGITKAEGLSLHRAQFTNLVAGVIAGQASSHSVDMVGDLKTGHLLGCSPVVQFWAQMAGSVVGIWVSVGLFVLFATAYPCITDLNIKCTAFGMPSVSAWRAVTIAVTSHKLPVPASSGYTSLGLAFAAILTVVIKYQFIPEKYHAWVPNWNGIGLGFVIPQAYYPVAMIIGAHVAHYWQKKRPTSWEMWGFALAAGMIAGEGMGGVLTALLVIVKVDGSVYGSAVACPAYEFCG